MGIALHTFWIAHQTETLVIGRPVMLHLHMSYLVPLSGTLPLPLLIGSAELVIDYSPNCHQGLSHCAWRTQKIKSSMYSFVTEFESLLLMISTRIHYPVSAWRFLCRIADLPADQGQGFLPGFITHIVGKWWPSEWNGIDHRRSMDTVEWRPGWQAVGRARADGQTPARRGAGKRPRPALIPGGRYRGARSLTPNGGGERRQRWAQVAVQRLGT